MSQPRHRAQPGRREREREALFSGILVSLSTGMDLGSGEDNSRSLLNAVCSASPAEEKSVRSGDMESGKLGLKTKVEECGQDQHKSTLDTAPVRDRDVTMVGAML